MVNKEFIANNLCEKKQDKQNTCQGKCHLSKEIIENSDLDTQSKKDQNSKNKNIEVLFLECLIYENFLLKDKNNRTTYSFLEDLNLKSFCFSILKPPISF